MLCHEDSETIEGVQVGGERTVFFFRGGSGSFIGRQGLWCASVVVVVFFFFC